MKQAFLFLAKFIALTAPLTWLWMEWGAQAYRTIHAPAAHALYGILGLEQVLTPGRERFISIIPYLALLLLTPRLSLRRRLVGLVGGLATLFLVHIFVQRWADPESHLLPFSVKMFLDAFPFALWALFAHEYVRELLENTIGKHLALTPAPPKDPAGRKDSATTS